MRVTLVHASYYYSGSEKSVELLARWLLDNGHEVKIVSAGNYKAPTDLKDIEINVLPHKSTALQLHALLPLARFMKHNEDSTDIYHIYNVFPMAAAGLYKLLGGKRPVIATLNNYAGFCPTANAIYDECNRLSCKIRCLRNSTDNKPLILPYAMIYSLLTRLSLKLDRYIAISNAVKRLYVKYGYPEDMIVVIPNFVPISHISECHNYTDNKQFKIVYVGTLSYHKGTDILIKSIGILKQKYNINNVYLTLVGDSNDKNYHLQLIHLIKDMDIARNVIFRGYVNHGELSEIYSAHDVLVHPSRWHEPFGRTILEALMYGLPCIVSDVGAPAEIIEDAGMVFRNNDPEDLADKIYKLINNKTLHVNMSINALQIINKYNINIIGQRIVKLYEEIVKND
ncbi:MAG: glycosyltransferase family 4 protein [Candidatus Anstonellales archaeon]